MIDKMCAFQSSGTLELVPLLTNLICWVLVIIFS